MPQFRRKSNNASSPENRTGLSRKTEVEAYAFIRAQLRDLGWRVKDPNRTADGQVWTQNQCLADEDIRTALGKKHPENIVKTGERLLWVIEAKASRAELNLALEEAREYYCERINAANRRYTAHIATGVAGNESDGYLMRTIVRCKGRWQTVTINKQEATGLLSPSDVKTLLEREESDVHDFAPPQWLFINAAERINSILHDGGINKNERAKTMAALLLSVIHDCPNLDSDLPVLIDDINARSKAELRTNGKGDFARFVEILPPTNTSNHVNFKRALVKTILELQNLNIRSAMNSSTDVLGQFYEVFLKYGNGAKEIGIVLTPRHVTHFAVEALAVGPKEIILDPACGTGGFLVAAFDRVRRNCSAAQINRFKKHNLFGIEQDPCVAVLAIVNMIFRGDGRNNIVEGNCFSTHLTLHAVDGHATARYVNNTPSPGSEPVTRVLMNPPFALAQKEYTFVARALEMMVDGGILFSLLPLDAMFGSHDELVWRRDELLKKNSLLAVVSFPSELFYPAALKQVVGVVVKKGLPHQKRQRVFWARLANDGQVKIKSKRLAGRDARPPRNTPDDLPRVLPQLTNFIANPATDVPSVPMLCKTSPIDYDDPLLELLPEAYLDGPEATVEELTTQIKDVARHMAAFLVSFGFEDRADDYR